MKRRVPTILVGLKQKRAAHRFHRAPRCVCLRGGWFAVLATGGSGLVLIWCKVEDGRWAR